MAKKREPKPWEGQNAMDWPLRTRWDRWNDMFGPEIADREVAAEALMPPCPHDLGRHVGSRSLCSGVCRFMSKKDRRCRIALREEAATP